MTSLLAMADGSDHSTFNMEIVLIGVFVAAGCCVLGAIPILTARRRQLAQIEGISAIMILWGLLTAGSVIYGVAAQMNYTREYDMRVMQNYDARDQSDRPAIPWLWWTTAAIAWGGAMLWSSTARSTTRRGFDVKVQPSADDPRS